MKELQACSYLVSLNYGTLLNCAHYYSTVSYISLFYLFYFKHNSNKAVRYIGGLLCFTGHD